MRAPFLLAQAVIPDMRERRFGRIVFISSVAAFPGGVLAAHHAASKAGLLGLSHALAHPLARDGITVNAITPALIETGMLGGETAGPEPPGGPDASGPAARRGRWPR